MHAGAEHGGLVLGLGAGELVACGETGPFRPEELQRVVPFAVDQQKSLRCGAVVARACSRAAAAICAASWCRSSAANALECANKLFARSSRKASGPVAARRRQMSAASWPIPAPPAVQPRPLKCCEAASPPLRRPRFEKGLIRAGCKPIENCSRRFGSSRATKPESAISVGRCCNPASRVLPRRAAKFATRHSVPVETRARIAAAALRDEISVHFSLHPL
jgi:hypothetical protein